MMWSATPAYFAIVLMKTIWFGGLYDQNDLHWVIPPQAAVSVVVEPTMEKCNLDGKKWELEGGKAAIEGSKFPINNGVWKCGTVATGGLEAKLEGSNQ